MDTLLKDLTLYIEHNKATQTEKEHFIRIIQNLKSSRRVRFIYRGESKLEEIYNTDLRNIPILSKHIFVLGEKGRMFLNKKSSNYNNAFLFIWDKFHNKICKNRFTTRGSIEKVSMFLKNNPEITEFFSDECKQNEFVNYSELPDKERRIIIDYYLAILHTIGKSGNDNSYFLSSTKDISIANEFIKNSKGIILYGWVPKEGIKEKIIKYADIEENNAFVESLGLPTYRIPVYPKQKEICLKCGLLPHFTLGFQSGDKFQINPATLKPWGDDIIYNGLDVEQFEFNNYFKDCNYTSSCIFLDGNYYIISKDGVSNI